jgi:transposase
MDWHSSGITTSVIGALKRGLTPLHNELGIHVCGGRGKHSRHTPQELVAIGDRVGVDGTALAKASRLVAKVDSAAVHDGFDLYLHGFIVTDDGNWTVVQQGMNGARKQARRYHWLSEGLKSFVDDPHAAIDGKGQGEIVNLADRRAEASRRTQLDLLSSLGPDKIAREYSALETRREQQAKPSTDQPLLPHLIMPAHHDVRGSDVIARRLHGNLAAAVDRGPKDFPDLLLTPGVGARTIRPYSKGQKNDFRDAEAIAEAVLRPTMKFVAIKTVEQLDLQGLHRVRERLVCQRTSVINQIRAFLLERGIAVRQGLRALRTAMPNVLAMTDKLSPRMIHMIEDLCTDWRHLDARIMTVPGIGPIISTATVAAIGSGDVFSKGRDFGAWLGLVPRQMSTGGRTILGPISKRGNRYLRMLFVQAARSVLLRPKSWQKYGLKSWIEAAARRLNRFKLAIALANKIARVAWGVLNGGRNFEVRSMRTAPQAG